MCVLTYLLLCSTFFTFVFESVRVGTLGDRESGVGSGVTCVPSRGVGGLPGLAGRGADCGLRPVRLRAHARFSVARARAAKKVYGWPAPSTPSPLYKLAVSDECRVEA